MSGKLTLDTSAGGSVTLTCDDTQTADVEVFIDDAGIESGSNTNGTYAKFPDGTLICTHTINLPARNVAKGQVFESSSNPQWTFPYVFISIPSVSGASQTSSTWLSFFGVNGNYMSIKGWAAESDGVAIDVYLSATGRWK